MNDSGIVHPFNKRRQFYNMTACFAGVVPGSLQRSPITALLLLICTDIKSSDNL